MAFNSQFLNTLCNNYNDEFVKYHSIIIIIMIKVQYFIVKLVLHLQGKKV